MQLPLTSTNREKAALAMPPLSQGTVLAQGEHVWAAGWLGVSWMLLRVHYGEQLVLKAKEAWWSRIRLPDAFEHPLSSLYNKQAGRGASEA